MEIERILAIITALADGCNPVTGELLEPTHVCQQPDVIRALHVARGHIEREAKRERRLERARLTLPANTGKAWTGGEDRALAARFRLGTSVADMATLHARTPGAIAARLERLGLVAPADAAPPRGRPGRTLDA
jgi:hypothetical protein